MPTSTLPFEVLFEFTNDTANAITLQLTRGDDEYAGSFGGAVILLHSGENVSLVLDAGSTYHYTVKQQSKKAQISIRTWRDVQCTAAGVFSGQCEQGVATWAPIQGVTVTCLRSDT